MNFSHEAVNMVDNEILDPADFGLKVGPMDKFVAELIRIDPELREIRNSFLRNLQSEFESLRVAFQECNWKVLRDRAHSLRGSAGNYGFVDLFDWASAVEKELAHGAGAEVMAKYIEQLKTFSPPSPPTSSSLLR